MIRPPPRSTRTDTLFPYTTLFRSALLESSITQRVGCLWFPNLNQSSDVGLSTNLPVFTWLLFDCSCTRSEEHTSELQSLMRISYAVFCLKKKKKYQLKYIKTNDKYATHDTKKTSKLIKKDTN